MYADTHRVNHRHPQPGGVHQRAAGGADQRERGAGDPAGRGEGGEDAEGGTTMTEFTKDFIAAELAKAARATARPWDIVHDCPDDCYYCENKKTINAGCVDTVYIITAANHYEAALRELQALQARAEKAEGEAERLREVMEKAKELLNDELGEWAGVEKLYVPVGLMGYIAARDTLSEALEGGEE